MNSVFWSEKTKKDIAFIGSNNIVIIGEHVVIMVGISKDGVIKRGLSNGSLFASREEAMLKYENLRNQSLQERGFKGRK